MAQHSFNVLCVFTGYGDAWKSIVIDQFQHIMIYLKCDLSISGTYHSTGGGPRVVVNTAAFHATVRGSVPGLGGLKETKMFLPHPRVKVSIVGSPRDREVACSASDRQGSNFVSCVWSGSVISIISPSSGGSPGPV